MTKIIALRMERQFLTKRANVDEYINLYQDLQPGNNVYWTGFGDPPSLTYRADFNDMEFNRERQKSRSLIKGRFVGGNLGWIMKEDLELFACAFCKPLLTLSERQSVVLDLINQEGPLNIQLIKEITGMLVKEITPVLHRLQEAFLVYEDQYDGEWDRGWYKFSEMFPNVNLEKYSRVEALEILLQRFAYRQVWFDDKMAKSFYKLPLKDIKTAINSLKEKEIIIEYENGYILEGDADTIKNYSQELSPCTFTLHRNDFLYRSNEHILKTLWKRSGVETLYYILIDGEFRGAAYGKFRNGPPDFSSIEVDLPNNEAIERKQEIIKSTQMLSFGKTPEKYNGENL